MNAFSIWTLIAGAYLVLAGVLILVVVCRRRKSRAHEFPAYRPVDAYAPGRVELPRAAGVRGPARGRVVADVQAAVAATTLLLPAAHTPVGGGFRAGQAPPRIWPAHQDVRLDGVLGVAPRRAWVPVPGRGCGAGTPQLPAWATPRAMQPYVDGREPGRVYRSNDEWTRAAASTTAR